MGRTAKGVCFGCRLCFHQHPLADGWKCSVCGQRLTHVGYYFKAPPRHRVRAWRRIEQALVRLRPEWEGQVPVARLWFHRQPKLSRKAVRLKEKRETEARKWKKRWKTCGVCGRFMKNGVISTHLKACGVDRAAASG